MSKEERKKRLEQLYRMVCEFNTTHVEGALRNDFVKICRLVAELCRAEGVDMLSIDKQVEASMQNEPLPIYPSSKPSSGSFNERVETERKRLSAEI